MVVPEPKGAAPPGGVGGWRPRLPPHEETCPLRRRFRQGQPVNYWDPDSGYLGAVVETVLEDGGYTLSGGKRTFYGNDLTLLEERRQGNTELRQDDGGQALHWELEEDG